MLMCSNSVFSNEPLKKVELERLVKSISSPKPEVKNLIDTLRLVYNMDVKRYSESKTKLPYFVCATFNPPYRKKENFLSTQYFILDIDKLGSKSVDINELKEKLCKDTRVHVCFFSPSMDGIKLIFKLKEKCFDSGLYSIFYKLFLKDFAQQYDLDQVIDEVTSDVSRACFISYDENCYYNPDSTLIDINMYGNANDSFNLFQKETKAEKYFQEIKKESQTIPKNNEPSDDVMSKIKSYLFKSEAKAQQERKENLVIPQRLTEIMQPLSEFILSFGIEIMEIKNINYGKQLFLKVDNKTCQFNIFCSKRNIFNVVPTTRRGTDPTLCSQIKELLDTYFDSL